MCGQLEILAGETRQRLGASGSHHDVITNAHSVNELRSYSIREPLAALAPEFHTLAGWQALDLGHPRQACTFYETVKAAREHPHPSGHAHALVEQTNTLLDLVERVCFP